MNKQERKPRPQDEDNEDPQTPTKYRPTTTERRGPVPPHMAATHKTTTASLNDIPVETKIFLSVFDDDPVGSPYRHEERST